MKIAVIGGGITGLTLAYYLSKHPQNDITIYESSPHLGGLAAGFSIAGTSLERYYHHLFRSDTDIISLMSELGLNTHLDWHKSSTAIFRDNHIYPFMTPADLIKYPRLGLFAKLRLGLATLYLQRVNNWRQLEKVTAKEWLLKWCGKKAYQEIWEPLLAGKFSNFHDQISMAWFWGRIKVRATSRGKDGIERLGYIKGGFQVLIDKLEEEISRNKVAIHTEAKVEKIRQKGSRVEVMVNGKRKIFDKVISTIPSHVFKNIVEGLNKKYIEKLDQTDYIGAVVMIIESEESFMNYYWLNVNEKKAPFLVLIEHTNLIEKSNYKNKNILYLGKYLPHSHKYFEMDEHEIMKEWANYLKIINPNFDLNKINDAHLFKAKFAQHVVRINYSKTIPEYQTSIKNLYLSNFSQIYPFDRGTNYAVQEARKIYKLIMQK